MKIFSMLKPAVAAVGLCLGLTAFAQGEANDKVVQLADNKTKVSWADFAAAINDPSTITGTVDPESQVAINLANTKKAYLGDPDATPAVTGAKADSLAAQQALTVADNAYTPNNDQVTAWIQERDGYNAELTTLSSDKVLLTWVENSYTNGLSFNSAYTKMGFNQPYDTNVCLYLKVFKSEDEDIYDGNHLISRA